MVEERGFKSHTNYANLKNEIVSKETLYEILDTRGKHNYDTERVCQCQNQEHE